MSGARKWHFRDDEKHRDGDALIRVMCGKTVDPTRVPVVPQSSFSLHESQACADCRAVYRRRMARKVGA